MRKIIEKIKQWHITVALSAMLFAVVLCEEAGVLSAPASAGAVMVDGRPVEYQLAVINIWVQIAIMIISALITYAMTSKLPTPKPAALQDFDVPTAEEGRPIPVIFGTVWIKGPNVLWYGDLRSTPIRSKGGKK